MDDSTDVKIKVPDTSDVSLLPRNAQSDDESVVETNLESVDEDLMFNDIPDDEDDDFGSSSEVELATSPSDPSDFANTKLTKHHTDFVDPSKDNLSIDGKCDLLSKTNDLNPNHQSKRSSGRLRKEGKVPIQTKNLFPGRPRIRRRKFANNLSLNFSDSLGPFKSPSTLTMETLDQTSKSISENSLETDVSADVTSELSSMLHSTSDSDVMISSTVEISKPPEDYLINQSSEKMPAARKKLNYPGKIKGKLSGRKKAKTAEYRSKRGPKGKLKNFTSPVLITNFPSTSGTNFASNSNTHDSDKQDDSSNENKIILCSTKDYFVLTQDVCIMCGSLGKDEESKLLSCSQCGQCYHPFCAGVTKITKVMLKKGWRCLECTVCEGCGKPTDESRLLLCDECDISYHTYCLDPPLQDVPQGTWKCQWCVVCMKCSSTSPGYGSQWQANYTLCGPCASQENCSCCKNHYQENELIIQCIQCNRWLHAKCDSMFNEDECEIASSIGYNCKACRPVDQPPPHIQARKNGTLRSILNKKRAEEKVDLTASKSDQKGSTTPKESTTDTNVIPSGQAEITPPITAANKLISKYHYIDGVYLSDSGLAMIKSLMIEQPKKTRVKRKSLLANTSKEEQDDLSHKDFDENSEEKLTNDSDMLKNSEEERKKRQRRLRLEKLGIGGFSVKQRGRLSSNKEDDEVNSENVERSGTPDALDKPKRRRRITKKKSQLQDLFPSYMQEAFFGKELMDTVVSNSEFNMSDKESDEDESKSIGKDKIVVLSPVNHEEDKNKNDDISFFDENFQGSLDLHSGDGFDDFLPLSPDEMIMDMLINDENLGRNDEVLEELTNNSKVDEVVKDEIDILDSNFNFNDIDDSGLPRMDGKDVEDLFNEVMSDSSIQQSKEFQLSVNSNDNNNTPLPVLHKPNVDMEPLQLPILMQPNVEIPSTVSTPATPHSTDSLTSLQQQFASFDSSNPSLANQFNSSINTKPQPETQAQQVFWQNTEPETETSTQGQKNFLKWESEEALGHFATISPVLYANMNHTNLKNEYPVWSDRLKQISKLWRQLSSEQRQPYLQKARENRAANRIQKSQADSMSKLNVPSNKDLKNETEKQWKELQGPNSNSTAIVNDPNVGNIIGGQPMPSQTNEMAYPLPSDYNQSPANKLYSPSQMALPHAQQKMQPSPNQMMMNRPPPTPGPTQLPSPMSPAMHSPRLRPVMPGGYPDNFTSQQHQIIARPSSIVSQGSFSPASPSLNPVHSMSSTDCYQSSPSTPQRPQSTDPQHQYNQTASPAYGGPPRTPSSVINPFSPNQHSQIPMHQGAAISNDNFALGTHQTQSQNSVDNSQNMDMYKVNMTPQHQISKPHTPDASYVSSLSSSLPSTPQPPPSPQLPVPSPLNDIYARSPATPRPTANIQVRPSQFDEGYSQRPMQNPDMFPPNNNQPNAYQQPFMQQTNTSYSMNDGYNINSPGAPKVQMRPNMPSNVRPNIPIRRAVSDPYARQPMTPMPSSSADSSSHSFNKTEDSSNDQTSKQHLRNLLQVQQMRRPDPSAVPPNPQAPVARPSWGDNSFRQPLSPAISRNKIPITSSNQFPMEQTFRFSNDQRMLMHRNPEMRFRQVAPNQQFQVRYSQHQQMGQLPQSQPQQANMTKPVHQQQWPRMSLPNNSQDSGQIMQPGVNQISQTQSNNPASTTLQQIKNESQNSEMNAQISNKIEVKNPCGQMSENKSSGDILSQLHEDEGLSMELGDGNMELDDELLELGNDFNILEYGDPELADKSLGGHSGKSHIFDELDEKDMLSEKEKDNTGSNKANKPIKSEILSTQGCNKILEPSTSFNQPNYSASNPPTSHVSFTQQKSSVSSQSDNDQMVPKQEPNYFQNLSNTECFMSDDDFERLKNDFLNDPSEQINPMQPGPSQMNSFPPPPQPPAQQITQHMNIQPQQQQPASVQQVYHPSNAQQFPHQMPTTGQQQTWPEQSQQFNKVPGYQNRIHMRMPMNQSGQIVRHVQAPMAQQGMYPQPGNRMIMQQSGTPMAIPTPVGQVRHQIGSIPPPPLPPHEPKNDQERQQQQQYEQWLIQQNNYLSQQQKNLETDVSKLRKLKKSLNAKQRQCRKNQSELSEHDANELARITQEQNTMQKQLEQARKMFRQHSLVFQEYRQKYAQSSNLPHSPGAQTVQTSPRSVNSPLAVLNTSGPGTPLGICAPSTPQSPSITSPSPSSLMQNSPMSNLHSPASLMPPSPIHHSPMTNNPEHPGSVRPQIVQDDNNPFSDVYLQKEKKQHMQQSPAYSHSLQSDIQSNVPMSDTRQQMYPNNYPDDNMSHYYHSQPNAQSMPPYQIQTMRPQSQMHFQNMNNSNNFRFNSSHGQPMSQQYSNQSINYTQIRRPPPPPYPGSSQHYGQRPVYQNTQQVRPQQIRPPECINPRMQQPIYGDTGSIISNDSAYNMNASDQIPMLMDGSMVSEAKTTMEFNISELGNGHDNESDPFTFMQEQKNNPTKQPVEQTSNNTSNSNESPAVNNEDSVSAASVPNNDTAHCETTQNNTSNISIKNEINDEITDIQNSNQQQVEPSQSSFKPNIDDGEVSRNDIDNFTENSLDESEKARLETNRQNALLKQLLQNCPSADLKSLSKDSQTPPSDLPSNDVNLSDTEIKIENDNSNHLTSCMEASKSAVLETQETIASIEKTSSTLNDNNNNTDNIALIDPNSSTNAEKKLTYLDIRRAQLERDPTPPPEDVKPKRKRTVKRKESNKSLDESFENSCTNQMNTTPKVTKKRSRKGSQTKGDDNSNNTNDTNEQILTSILNHLRSLPSVHVIEPIIKQNMNVCQPSNAPDFNSKESKLRGCYGNGYLSSTIDYYSTYPFGPNKASSVVPTLPPSVHSNTSHNSHGRGFYNEEFSRVIPDLKEHLKERNENETSFSLYARDIDSPETVVSSSSPECVQYDYPDDEYNKMKYINDENDHSGESNRKSPLLSFMPLPIRPTPVYSNFLNENAENDKENYHDAQKSKMIKLNSGIPLKDSANVGITLMLTSEHDVRNILTALAKLLKVNSSITYNIEKSSSIRVTEVLELDMKSAENNCCKFCKEHIKDEAYQPEMGTLFCNKECYKNYFLANKIESTSITNQNSEESEDFSSKNSMEIDDKEALINDSLTNEIENDQNEAEIMSILEKDSVDENKDNGDLESDISIHEKRWKNTRYLNWKASSFKSNQKPPKQQDGSIDTLLDKLEICLKPNKNAVEKRQCIFCHQVGDGDINGSSRLLNMDVDKWVHLNCALWSNEVYEMLNGALMNVDQAYKRSMSLHCVSCTKVGASMKCFKIRCNNSYHFPCAIREKCMFFKDKTIFCPVHSPKSSQPNPDELTSFSVSRRVYINRDEQKQIAAMIHQGDSNLMRIGSLIFLNIGQLLPHQLQNFHTNSYIYPVGYKVSRFYWSSRRIGKRCQYICSINEVNGKPDFSIEIREEGFENVTYQSSTPKLVWQKIIESIVKLREDSQNIKVFFDFISGEDLFGLTEPAIIRILESLPGVDTLYDYNFKYGRSPWYELPLAINPTGCARTEPKMRTHFKRPHKLHVSSNNTRSSLHSSLTTAESSSPYVKQFVHSKISQYRKMKLEWRNNVYLARSRIQGLGLYAFRDIEKHTMIIEYIGLLIRNEMAERNERIHEAHNRGIYMFRLDDNTVIDATLCGGLARYVNHSCDPNCVAESVQIDRENKILIIANRRIQSGEELTYDYKFEVEDDQHKIPCLCGAANCRKWMN